eukprot:1145754-Pelagomonas_calceolata.AAC.5
MATEEQCLRMPPCMTEWSRCAQGHTYVQAHHVAAPQEQKGVANGQVLTCTRLWKSGHVRLHCGEAHMPGPAA